mmetsp:Transcript_18242/g.61976  ORF Transcript_18242/g.61976 Transcript_18242/m.61976 type:complete len:197 (+) Transcript_18242:505-1095(+)
MSAGVTCVKNGIDLFTNSPPDFDMELKNITQYHGPEVTANTKDQIWIVEGLQEDELDCFPLRDFKFIMNGGEVLAVMIMSDVQYDGSKPVYGGSKEVPYNYLCATVDKDFNLMAPWNSTENPFVRTLVQDKELLTSKPDCWSEMVHYAQKYGAFLNIFCRVDFFATKKGAMFCELETIMNADMFSKQAKNAIMWLW